MPRIKDLAEETVAFAREIYGEGYVPLHRPIFEGNEERYLVDCVKSNFVSSVGELVTKFETEVARYTGCRYAIATVNGTTALETAIRIAGVAPGDEVVSQALTFVATANAISHVGAQPIFLDVDRDTLGLSPSSLLEFLEKNATRTREGARSKLTNKRISACVPMHTFGFPCRINEIAAICDDWNIALVEDAAESLGSYFMGRHTGSFGELSAISFNGNKIITTGGGGMILTDSDAFALRAKHITTTAKVPHPYEFVHDEIGFNYRMPNINAALGCAQMERIGDILPLKLALAKQWEAFFNRHGLELVKGINGTKSNHWLNAIVLESREERDEFLRHTNEAGVMTRPIWELMSNLPMFKNCETDGLQNSIWLRDRVVNVPSSVPNGMALRV